MKDARHVHTFHGTSAQVTVEKTANGFRFLLLPPRADHGHQLTLGFLSWVSEGTAEAREVAGLLRSAAELAAWIERGGKVEHWFADGASRHAFDSN
jgi:hypothetical protein